MRRLIRDSLITEDSRSAIRHGQLGKLFNARSPDADDAIFGGRRVVAAATPAAMPGIIKPQLATLKAKAPAGDQWLHEIKFDGYRVQVHLDKGKKQVFTRNGLDWTKRFSVIAGTLDISG
jgi:ATP-dependent DNA ligase